MRPRHAGGGSNTVKVFLYEAALHDNTKELKTGASEELHSAATHGRDPQTNDLFLSEMEEVVCFHNLAW